MKKVFLVLLAFLLIVLNLAACSMDNTESSIPSQFESEISSQSDVTDNISNENTKINLSDTEITVNGEKISQNKESAVYAANDIVYYEEGKDFTYGEGEKEDEHTKDEADAHTVVHITEKGIYEISGSLSKGQIAVDLGEEAENDETAAVTLILNEVDITCEVAPAVIFYSVYECGNKDAENATSDVDTSKAGANVIIKDGTENNVRGSYVARIYKEGTVVLNDSGTEVEDAKKLHKYDGAFYSKMSMNIFGEENDSGVLNIFAENEGLDSELHLSINGGNINIVSGNDGINTNEDNVSVTTINGGKVSILCNGATGEGDGIDSNGWLVINGGSVTAQACAKSADAGIDSDMGIIINGGNVFATGNMLDRISESKQNFAVFNFSQTQQGGEYILKNVNGEEVAKENIENAFSVMIISSSDLLQGEYSLCNGEEQFSVIKTQGGGMDAGMMPGGEFPNDFNMEDRPEPPENFEMPNGEMPEFPGGEKPQKPEGEMSDFDKFRPDNFADGANQSLGQATEVFKIENGENYFMVIPL